jgi:hypothetical protein
MIIDFIARLLGSAPAPAAEAPPTAHRRYNEMIEQRILAARGCDAVDRLIDYLDDRNGHVREAAIDRAAELSEPAILPALAGRLNDWVAPVRDKARDAVLTLLGTLDPDKDAGAALHLLQDVEQLKLARRTDHAAWIANFERRLVEVLGAERILEAIGAKHGRVPQLSFTLARTYALADAFALCRRAFANKGNVALARQAMDLARGLGEAEQQDVYRLALDAPAGLVRAEALRALLRSNALDPAALAASMLADANTWVRLVASACLARLDIDVPGKYAERIAASAGDYRVLRACLAAWRSPAAPRISASSANTRHTRMAGSRLQPCWPGSIWRRTTRTTSPATCCAVRTAGCANCSPSSSGSGPMCRSMPPYRPCAGTAITNRCSRSHSARHGRCRK